MEENPAICPGMSEGLGLLSKEGNMVMPGFIVLVLVYLPPISSHMFPFLPFKCNLHHLHWLGSQDARLRKSLLQHWLQLCSTILWILSEWAVTCPYLDNIAVCWCSVLLLLSTAVTNMFYFPLSLHQQARSFQQGLHRGLSLLSSSRPGGKEFTACKCVGLLWLSMLWKIQNQHLGSHREMATVFPP